MMKRLLSSLFLAVVLLAFLPGRANAAGDAALSSDIFPDDIFRAYLTSTYDKDNNGVLSQTEIAAVTSLSIRSKGISSLTGIKYLTSLRSLDCSGNRLTALDVSGLTNLQSLYCYDNSLTTVNASGCTSLKNLDCSRNNITSLNITGCTALTDLHLSNNKLTSLDVRSLPLLRQLWVNYNSLSSLDVSKNTNLEYLNCASNQLTALDVSNCTKLNSLLTGLNSIPSLNVRNCPQLVTLSCLSNSLTSLDVTNCPELVDLTCSFNQISTLDVTKCPKLKYLTCNNNQLTALDLTNSRELTSIDIRDNYITALDISGTKLVPWVASGSYMSTTCFIGSQVNKAEIQVRMTAEQKESYDLNPTKNEINNAGVVPIVVGAPTQTLSITTQPASTTVTEGSTASFKVVATGASSYQWQWRASSSGTWANCSSATTGYNAATLQPVGTIGRNGYQYRCVIKDSSGKSVTSNTATLTVKAGLAITTQPANTTVTEGSTASFKVVATGASSYQWQWRASSSGTWANCSSATSGYNTATLKPVGTAARNGYQYRCVVKDASGNTVTSNVATLTVKAPLAITTQPASATVTEGSTAAFKVVATGASSYQWQWRASSSGTWANCSSATTGYNAATLQPVGTAARNGYQYRCVVTDASGKTVTSNVATLTVKVPLAITTQPASTTVTEGSTATFKVVATGASSYQWQWRASSSGTWANCSSATTGYNTATLKPVGTAARNGYQYRCVVKDASGKTVTSNTATLTVKVPLAITTQPASITVNEGTTATFKVVATGASSYQWQWRASSTGTWANCSSATSGYNTATLKPVATSARNGYQYRCVVKDASGGTVISNAATLTVKSVLAITTQPISTTVTEGSNATFKVVATGASSYQWQWRASSSGTWTNCSSATTGYNTATLRPVATSARNGYQYRCVVKDSTGKTVTSNIATMTVTAAKLNIIRQPVDYYVPLGATAFFDVGAQGEGLSYQWQYKSATGTTWANSSNTTAKNDTLEVKAETSRHGMQFRCVITDANGGTVTSNAATLKVIANITSQPQNATVKTGETAKFTVGAVGVGLTYQWEYRIPGGYWTEATFTGAKSATLSVDVEGSRNGMQFRCRIIDANNFYYFSDSAVMIIASDRLQIVSSPESITTQETALITFTVGASGKGLTYQWQYRPLGGTTWQPVTAVAANTERLTFYTQAKDNGNEYRCQVRDSAGNTVYSEPNTLSLYNGSVFISEWTSHVCPSIDSSVTIDVVATGNDLTYQWQYRTPTSDLWTNVLTEGHDAAELVVQASRYPSMTEFRCIVRAGSGSFLISSPCVMEIQ